VDNSAFISYRRDASAYLARAIFQDLRAHDIDVFMDVESINAGQFNKIIVSQIAARPYFLLLLTPGTLERCKEPIDWLRNEIEQALTTKRQIVLLHTPKFDFEDINRFLESEVAAEIKLFNAVDVPHNYFEAAMDRLRTRFLIPIDLPSTPAPQVDSEAVQKNLAQIAAEPKVTQEQLSAQEYFERALARPESEVDGIIADYTEALRLNPQYADAYNNRSTAFLDKGDIEQAIADCDAALRLDPQLASAYINRANALVDKGDIEKAVDDYYEAIRLDPDAYIAYFNRGNVFFDEGDVSEAIDDHSEAIRINPNYSEAYFNRAVAFESRGDNEHAIADYTESIRLYPERASAYYNRGNVYLDLGDFDSAIADYDKALQLDPGHEGAQNNRQLALRTSKTDHI